MPNKVSRHPRAFVVVFALICLLGSSCRSPLVTRDPEPPEDQGRTNWIPPTQARDVLTNLRNAMQDKNLTNYLDSFTDSPVNGRGFGFRPDQNALLRFPGIWDSWSLAAEGTYVNNAFQSMPADSIPHLVFVGDLIETPLPDSTILITDYELRFPHTRPKDQFPSMVRGRLEFRLATTQEGFWAVYFWIDESQDDSPSWSELKALFSE